MIAKSYEIIKNKSKFLKYNFFLLYGENYGLKKDIQKLIKTEFNNPSTNLEILSLYENDITDNEENFYNLIYSGSLFSNKKVITINNVTDKTYKTFEDILDKYPDNVTLIVFSNILEKRSKLRSLFEKDSKTLCIPCYPDNESDLRIIAKSEFTKNKISLSNESINLLVDKSNNDRNNLKNEIEKIKSFSLNKKSLEIEEVRSIINFSGEHKSDSLINECLCGNILQYKKILHEIYMNTTDQIFFLRILSNKINRLFSMKKMEGNYSNIDSLLNASKPPIFWKEKPMVKKQLTVWNLDSLNLIMAEINNTELLCKKNPQLSKMIFFNFFTKLCKQANNYS